MTKEKLNTLETLHNFVAKLILVLEDDLAQITITQDQKRNIVDKPSTISKDDSSCLKKLKMQQKKSNITETKNITETLNKLVHLINQLTKLADSENLHKKTDIDIKDQIIIDSFLKNYPSQ